MTDPRRSLASPLAALYWLLVIYASLHPFTDWSVPPLTPGELLRLPHTYSGWLDRTINITGYLPLGFLLATAWMRQGWRRASACTAALAFASLTSYTMEVTQSFLPARVPSVLDWINNSLGAAAGVALALVVDHLGVFDALKRSRRRWLTEHSTPGLLLLQMEVPEAENWSLLKRARKAGLSTLLNVAPARALPTSILPLIDWLIDNELEVLTVAAAAGHRTRDPYQAGARLASGVIALIMDTSREHWLETGATEALPDVGQRCMSVMQQLLAIQRPATP